MLALGLLSAWILTRQCSPAGEITSFLHATPLPQRADVRLRQLRTLATVDPGYLNSVRSICIVPLLTLKKKQNPNCWAIDEGSPIASHTKCTKTKEARYHQQLVSILSKVS